MYGIKRIPTYMEVEYAKGRLNSHSSKRPVICCLVSSPCVGDLTLRNEYQGIVGLLTKSRTFQKSPTPNFVTPQNLLTPYSITPQDAGMTNETKKTPNPCLKGGQTTSNMTNFGQNPWDKNQQTITSSCQLEGKIKEIKCYNCRKEHRQSI
jgi:hypothetical protein